MKISKLKNYSDFLGIIEYPAVLFCDDGEVLGINNSAVKILGSKVESLSMEPDKFMLSDDFWSILEHKKTIIWHRLSLIVNSKEKYVTSGFVNQFEYEGQKAYMVLFELRSDVSIGSVSLERIINHVGLIALYLFKPNGIWQTRYVSKNIAEYGYAEEEFYKGNLRLSDLVVKSDYDVLVGMLYKANTTDVGDFEMSVRFIAADKSIRRTNVKCHLVKTPDGDVDGIEFLFIKSGPPAYDEHQSNYILSAMSKLKSFVLVQNFEYGKEKFVYITPNAKSLGINVDILANGNRLMSDYIHPADRARVISNTQSAIRTGKSDFEDEFRIVTDIGTVMWVKRQSSVTQSDDNSYTVEQFISDMTDKKDLESSVVEAKKVFEDKLSYIMNSGEDRDEDKTHIDIDKWNDIVKAFSALSGLYSTVIAPDGTKLTEPAGPAEHIGSFYDLFEKPQYKSIYMELNDVILKNNVPVMMEMDDGKDGSMICGAPIIIGDRHAATWIACAYDSEDVKNMENVYKLQWKLCNIFSEYAYSSRILSKEAMRSKSMEMMLEEKVQRQKILTDALNAMDDDSSATINAIMAQTGEYLNVDVMAIYAKDEDGVYDCSYLWTRGHNMSAEEYIFNWQKGKSLLNNKRTPGVEYILVDNNHKNKIFEEEMENGNVKSFVAFYIEINNLVSGVFVMANTNEEKIWTKEELEFANDIRNVIQGRLTRIEGDGNISNINKLLVDTYNYLEVGIFIRDAETGEVLFSNQPLNNMLGYDFTGKDSKILIEDLHDKFKGIGVVQKPFLTERKEVSWRSYIKQLDKIMDLSEVSMKWLDGRNASLVILRDVHE